MVYSMTAFASHQVQADQFLISWEIRSVNSRYLDLVLRLPDKLRFLEPQIRKMIGQSIQRGKIECSARLDPVPDAKLSFTINAGIIQAVIQVLEQVRPLLSDPAPVSPLEIISWPGVLSEPEPAQEALQKAALEGLQEALDKLIAARRQEGSQLKNFLLQRCQQLGDQVKLARQAAPEALAALREKLIARIEEVSIEPDRDRLEQELVYLAQKLDVAEELDRLETHIKETRRLLEQDQAIGRRLDFLFQEMNREANTLASKSASTALTQCAIEMKVLIDQMREQAQNIE